MTLALATQQLNFFEQVVHSAQPESKAAQLLTMGRATETEQFAIYRRAYIARLVDCLRDDYPLVELALGAECFEDLCQRYAHERPPRTNSLNFYGRDFASFLQTRVTPDLAWTYDLARVSWALIEAIHCDATQVLTPSMFAQFEPEQWPALRLQTSATLQVLSLEYDIAQLLIDVVTSDTFTQKPVQRPTALAICRRDNDVWRLPLMPWAAILLEKLQREAPLGEALDELSRDTNPSITESDVFQTFAEWLEAGVFRSVAPH